MGDRSLQIPESAGPSRPSPGSRTVSVSVSSSAASPPASRKRASHAVSSSQQQQEPQPHQQSAYQDVYAHPAAVSYANQHPRRAIPKFGPYLLLQTLGEGEFGKVKLGLHSQWGEEVAVKLIRRGNVDTSVRMSKVEREIEVLRTLKHPNIVRLYDVIETDKYIGIILEYASGGELFDHILAHRYLKEKDATKLFSQLISGVWYIHQKKIVHRDLKLENLLLDRNRNVIITDFGFANRFEHRSDDLMQTSCGSPCYAAPELVISEGLYVGSAVDIWSCGVILYAMLAGYLPFDDDPANPDGDNINLLYKYIVNTPLSFPDYVSIEARDLLGIMLVPDPLKRADLSMVMAHPWLAQYAHTFQRPVDELESAALDQHQLKRQAYQRQMKAAAVAADQAKVARSQSARSDVFGGTASSPAVRSKTYRDTHQSEYLYDSSVDQSMYVSPVEQSSTSAGRKGAASAIVLPSPPALDDDPFGPPPGASARSPDEVKAQGDARGEPRARKESRDDAASSRHQPVVAPVKDSPQPTSKKSGFRHTIQVEYGDSNAAPELPSTASPPRTRPAGRRDLEDAQQRRPSEDRSARPVRDRTTSHTTTSHSNGVPATPEATPRRTSVDQNRTPKAVNPTSTSPTSTRAQAGPPSSMRNMPAELARTTAPPPEVSVQPPTSPAPEDKSMASMQNGEESTRTRKSSDKVGLGKMFGGSSNGSSRAPSEGSASLADTSNVANKPPTASTTHGASRTSLLTPTSTSSEAKKSRRSTLTVMVEPFKSIKGRKGNAAPKTAETPVREKEQSRPPRSAVPPPSKGPVDTSFGDVSRGNLGGSMGMPASTSKARKVMEWFRTKSKTPGGKEPVDPFTLEEQPVRHGTTPTPAVYNQSVGAESSSTINQSTTTTTTTNTNLPVYVTPPTSAPASTPAAGHTKRTPSSATDASFTTPPVSTPSISQRLRESMGGVVSSPAPKSSAPKGPGALRIHHGPVDQATITTRPPPEVMKHVMEVLKSMGVEVQLESEFKYRCIRNKRRKVGLGLKDGSGSGSLAAVNLSGSAGSGGVDRRGLPMPSHSSSGGAGGMLRGLLMRRQSSQVSSPGGHSTSYDEDANHPIVSEPASSEPMYGDSTNDAGDEVRFSVELTRIDRLNDTFSVDIRRLKGNLRSYKFLYDTLRDRADLQGR